MEFGQPFRWLRNALTFQGSTKKLASPAGGTTGTIITGAANMSNIQSIITEFENLAAKTQAAIAPLEQIASLVEVLMPSAAPQIKATIAIMTLLQTQGPALLADLQKVVADAEAAYATIVPAAA